MSRRFHHLLSWIALVAMLLHALSATVSYLKARADGVQVVEVCTSFGAIERIRVGADGQPVEAPPVAHAVHCDYCAAGQTPGLHPALSVLLREGGPQAFRPVWFPHARPHPAPRRSAHSPRAPPARP